MAFKELLVEKAPIIIYDDRNNLLLINPINLVENKKNFKKEFSKMANKLYLLKYIKSNTDKKEFIDNMVKLYLSDYE